MWKVVVHWIKICNSNWVLSWDWKELFALTKDSKKPPKTNLKNNSYCLFVPTIGQ